MNMQVDTERMEQGLEGALLASVPPMDVIHGWDDSNEPVLYERFRAGLEVVDAVAQNNHNEFVENNISARRRKILEITGPDRFALDGIEHALESPELRFVLTAFINNRDRKLAPEEVVHSGMFRPTREWGSTRMEAFEAVVAVLNQLDPKGLIAKRGRPNQSTYGLAPHLLVETLIREEKPPIPKIEPMSRDEINKFVEDHVYGRNESGLSIALYKSDTKLIRLAMVAMTDREDLPDGWKKRFKDLQFLLSPNAEAWFEAYEKGRLKSTSTRLAEKLAEAEKLKAGWIDKAVCRGQDVNKFHPERLRKRGRPKTGDDIAAQTKRRLRYLTKVCRGCPVTKECGEYGIRVTGKSGTAGYRVYGEQVLGIPAGELAE